MKLNKDKGWLLENFVFNVLKRSSEIYYFSGKNECDFVVQNEKKILVKPVWKWILEEINF